MRFFANIILILFCLITWLEFSEDSMSTCFGTPVRTEVVGTATNLTNSSISQSAVTTKDQASVAADVTDLSPSMTVSMYVETIPAVVQIGNDMEIETLDVAKTQLSPSTAMSIENIEDMSSEAATRNDSEIKSIGVTEALFLASTCEDIIDVSQQLTNSSENTSERTMPTSDFNTTKSPATNGVNLAEFLSNIPSNNGTRNMSFSSLISEIIGRSNVSKDAEPTTMTQPSTQDAEPTTVTRPSTKDTELTTVTRPSTKDTEPTTVTRPSTMTTIAGSSSTRNNTPSKPFNLTNGPPVREVKFQTATDGKLFHGGVQISGMNSGSIRPWSPLLIDNHMTKSQHMQNMSLVLNALKHKQHIDNYTIQVFADTVQIAASDNEILRESNELKMDLFSDIMCVGEELVKKIPVCTQGLTVSTNNLVLVSTIIKSDQSDSSVAMNQSHIDTHIQLSNNILEHGRDMGSDIRVSTITYRKMDNIVHASNKHISSHVVSVTVQYIKVGNTTEVGKVEEDVTDESAIIFEMKTQIDGQKQEDKRLCTFWDFSTKTWSTTGCAVVSKNSSHTSCECNHLTNFAILVMYIETENISIQSQQALFTLTTVGCSLSIACLGMTLICYIYLKMLSKEKIMIHANLSVALMLAQIIFVSSGDAHQNAAACKAVAILLHFLFLASFTWMLVEGIALYLCCTKGIFHHRDMRVKYFLLGWGLPVIIVVISLAARFPNYGRGPQYSCWLSVRDGLIWAFLGPMLAIVVTNFGVMGLVVKAFLTLKTNAEKTEAARLRGSLRAMMTLLPLLGLTWILSLLVPYSVVFHYFFVITNTVQGMCIFFLHCVCNDEIRKKFYEKRRRWSTTRTASDAEMTFPSRRKTGLQEQRGHNRNL